MFNDDQKDWMRYLNNLDAEKKCWCGWYLLDKCPNCPPGIPNSEKKKYVCKGCGRAPYEPGDKIIHRKGCKLL